MRTQLIGRIELDAARLAEDLDRSRDINYDEPYEEFVCGNPWKSAMLWAPGGDIHAAIGQYDPSRPAAFTAHAEHLPYVQEILRTYFDTDKVTFARLVPFTNSVLIPHCDYVELSDDLSKQRIAHRLHIVLATAENAMFSETDTVYRMRSGEVWFIDVTRPHSAGVLGDTRRVHLLIDIADVAEVEDVLKFDFTLDAGIPQANLCDRPPLAVDERAGLMSLASVLDQENLMDVMGLVIKKHYRRDGGPDFVWSSMKEIARLNGDDAIIQRVADLYKHTNLERIEHASAV
jgi:hypothetical protein